jgi:transposase-like protein
MAALVREWETSGEPRRAFARRHGLTVSQFDYWKRQVRGTTRANEAVRFAPVQVVERGTERRDSTYLELVLPGGERLTVHEGASVDLVRTVVAALRSAC